MPDFAKILGDCDTLLDPVEMRQKALDAEEVKDWPAAMMAWERVIDRCSSTPPQRYEAYDRIKCLRWNVDPVNTDPAKARPWKTLALMFRHCEWSWTDKDGKAFHVRTRLDDRDQKRIAASMRSFARHVLRLTDGIVKIEPEFIVLEDTLDKFTGKDRFWIDREDFRPLVDQAVAGRKYDCIIAYPKFRQSAEVGIPAAFGADAMGGDCGPGGAPFIEIPYNARRTYQVDGELELHEWLHHTHMIVMRLLGYPDGVDVNPDGCPRELAPGGDPNFAHPAGDRGFFMRYYEYMMQVRYTRLMWNEIDSRQPKRIFWGGSNLKDWLACGPFQASAGQSAMEQDFISERTVRPQQDVQSAGRSWRRMDSVAGGVDLSRINAANGEAAYLATSVQCGQDQFRLTVSAPGPVRLWLNGQKVDVRLNDPKGILVSARQGWNLLLIKAIAGENACGKVQASLALPNGEVNWGYGTALPAAEKAPVC